MQSKPHLSFFQWFNKPYLYSILILGYASGLPNEIITNLLSLWASSLHIPPEVQQYFSLLTIFYTLKFLFAPLFDRFSLPFLGRRKGWMLCFQVAIAICIVCLAYIDPTTQLLLCMCICALLALCSSLYDVVFDGYRIELLPLQDRSIGTTFSILGYRLTKIFSTLIIFFFLALIDWPGIFVTLAISIFCSSLVVIFFLPTENNPSEYPSWSSILIDPWKVFFTNPFAISLLLIILLYKLGDAMSKIFISYFLLNVGHFTTEVTSVINNAVALPFWLVGAFIASHAYQKMGLYKSLILFSIVQAVANLGYIAILYFPSNIYIFLGVTFFENASSGMITAPFIVFLMSLCKGSNNASQFAFFSAIAAVSTTASGPLANLTLEFLLNDWRLFFIACCLASAPAIILLYYSRNYFKSSSVSSTASY